MCRKYRRLERIFQNTAEYIMATLCLHRQLLLSARLMHLCCLFNIFRKFGLNYVCIHF